MIDASATAPTTQPTARRRDKLRERKRAQARKYFYGVTHDDVMRMLAEQGGRCATCPAVLTGDRHTDVDHDHATGAVRGLLCRRCNIRMSAVEDAEFMAAARAYLAKPR